MIFLLSLFFFRETGQEGQRETERNIDWLPPIGALTGIETVTQIWAMTREQTCEPLVHGTRLNPLSHPARARPLSCRLISAPLLVLPLKGDQYNDSLKTK